MNRPFKFRYVNEIVGGFVLLIVAALLVGVVLIGRAQQWFEPRFELRVRFPASGSEGIQKGADVVILGTQVGSVQEIVVNDDGSMEGQLQIRGQFVRFIRQDSQAILKKKFGVAGDAFVEITRGIGPAIEDGALPAAAKKDTELLQVVQDILENVRSAVLPLLEQVTKAAAEYTGLAADMRRPDGHLQQLLARLDEVAAGLQNGEGTAGKLLKDPATIQSVNAAITNVTVTIALVNSRLREVEAILADVKKTTGALPESLLQAQDTLRETEVLIEGVQKHWLLRSYIEQAPSSERINPADVRAPEGGAK
jgi:phospholipid/cholesterol/gamma-HCH transport system substrate-binding protein